MNLHHLSVFREVMKTGSMSEAAQNLGRTQPAISLAMKSLEDSLGITLFDRDTRNLKPVPEAYYLLAEADSMLGQMSRLRRTMKRMQIGDKGEVQLAVMPGVATVLFPDFLSKFAETRPDINLSMHTRSSTQLRELVSSQGVDFGFGDYDEDNSRTEQTRITRICANGFLAVPAGHELAQCETVPLAALDGLTFGGMQPDHRFEMRVQLALAHANARTHVRFRSQTVLPLLKFVSAGQCCAIVDPLTVLSARLTGVTRQEIKFCKLAQPVPYDYAILVPKMRRLTTLSRQLAASWEAHMMQELTALDAAPKTNIFE
ncbi:LysR family transcriptional regulator [Aestuariibius sp. HNIBRBA575]|uniref:LysR family transcriptional regulator n=1 Tax=Aestuariibius sp. HNIBRBA575 TaxID=3233343 RepID=UPI0034A1F13C